MGEITNFPKPEQTQKSPEQPSQQVEAPNAIRSATEKTTKANAMFRHFNQLILTNAIRFNALNEGPSDGSNGQEQLPPTLFSDDIKRARELEQKAAQLNSALLGSSNLSPENREQPGEAIPLIPTPLPIAA